MPSITLSNQARQDLVAIWDYIADDNPTAADRLLDTLEEQMQLLADHPFFGPPQPDIAHDLRYLVSGNYLILYRVLGEVVETVRVFHGARDLAAIFRDDRK
jgi:toxin ParE1/3/4